MENALTFYKESSHCDWLSALFTVKAETQVDKEAGMIAYVDQQDNVTEKANLVTASRYLLYLMKKDICTVIFFRKFIILIDLCLKMQVN